MSATFDSAPPLETCSTVMLEHLETWYNNTVATQYAQAAFLRYWNEFAIPLFISTQYFRKAELDQPANTPKTETLKAHADLMDFNSNVFNRNLVSSMQAFNKWAKNTLPDMTRAWVNSMYGQSDNNLTQFSRRQATLYKALAWDYPQAIDAIGPEFGFHFERPERGSVFAETDRFILYQVLPTDPKVTVNNAAKPIIILPPYVLGANILAFLPGEQRSYAHSFANRGIPTYIRVLKNIAATPALQTMTGEDDTRDTRYFCEKVKAKHGKPVTLNGYCQGGFSAVCNLLTGQLDGLVDALLTCVAPMDGTRSPGLSHFLKTLPPRFNDLAYGTKVLPNGNPVADGILMGWVYKLKSIETEGPLVAFYRDIFMLSPREGKTPAISKTAAAINYWLNYERFDLPLAITHMSFDSYNTPITADGTLPVKLFGDKLNLKRLAEKKLPWLICYGETDDLVEKDTALAPLDYIDVEVTPFPKGHVAIATSWSHPTSPYALDSRFGDQKQYRGPLRYHLDLDQALDGGGKG